MFSVPFPLLAVPVIRIGSDLLVSPPRIVYPLRYFSIAVSSSNEMLTSLPFSGTMRISIKSFFSYGRDQLSKCVPHVAFLIRIEAAGPCETVEISGARRVSYPNWTPSAKLVAIASMSIFFRCSMGLVHVERYGFRNDIRSIG